MKLDFFAIQARAIWTNGSKAVPWHRQREIQQNGPESDIHCKDRHPLT